jgi:hypothetical protein
MDRCTMLQGLMTRGRDALANRDPRARGAGAIALLVAINQPFYPLYLHAIAGKAATSAASAVELFLLPCILLAAVLFRPGERATMAPVLLAPIAAYLGADRIFGPPLHAFSVEEYRSMIALHAVSVGALIAFIGLHFSSALSDRGA